MNRAVGVRRLGTTGYAARDADADAPPVRIHGPWALDELRPAPDRPRPGAPSAARVLWARENRRWISAYTIARHRDHERGWTLFLERPDDGPQIWAEVRDTLDRRKGELRAAQAALEDCLRNLASVRAPP